MQSNSNETLQTKIQSITGILINESDEFEEIEKCGVGGKIWKSSFVLSSLLISQKLSKFINFDNKKILEIGAGAGICGLVCSKKNIKNIIITDRDSGCLQLIEKNIEFNAEKINKNLIEIKNFDWTNENEIKDFKGKYDIIIGSDLLYSSFMIEPFVKALDLMADEKTEILISLPKRGGEDSEYSNFINIINDTKLFNIEIIPNDLTDETFENVFTLLIKKRY